MVDISREEVDKDSGHDCSNGPSRSTGAARKLDNDGSPLPDRGTAETHASETSSDLERNLESKHASVPTQRRGWLRRLNPLRWRRIPPVPEERSPSREYRANFLSAITFEWMAPLMMTGYLRPLELQDIWLVNPERSVDVLTRKLNASFKRRVDRGDRYPLLWAIYETFRREFWVGGICQLFSALLQVMTPFTTRYLIAFATDAWVAQHQHVPGPHIRNGIGIAVGIFCMQVTQSLCTSQFFYRGMLVGGQSRAVLIDMIFVKSTKLSNRAKAGGKAIENGASQSSPAEPANAKAARDNLRKGIFSRKEKQKGPKVTKDVAAGIAGDGTGFTDGRIVTLMGVDTDRIDKAFGMFHLVWTSPVIIVVTLIMLLVNITYSALSGYALLVIGIPLLTHAFRTLIRRRIRINKITDQRVSLTQEILQAVRFVKFFGWESSFLERLNDLRRQEIAAIQIVMAIRNAILSVSIALPVFAAMLSFITYSLSNHNLDPARVFSSLALFNTLRMPLNMLPLVLGQVADAWTAIGRIQEFLLSEDQQDDIKKEETMKNAIEVNNASFTWERVATDPKKVEKGRKAQKHAGKKEKDESGPSKESKDDSNSKTAIEPFKISDLTFTAGRNELLAVIGTVGCGKSSLLAALAGDMRLTGGHVKMGTSRAFCPQYAWIQNATVKENIIFGKDFDEQWYNRVVHSCALTADLEMLPHGDRTEIGERGITVSGGQKQRLNIARAIYFDADLVLMDDPLSAVDAHVGRHIMDNAICGLLKDKCRILATHQLHVLSRCDRIILMDQGKIEAVDTFDNLMRDSESFRKLMATTAQEEGSDEERSNDEADDDEKKKKDAGSTQVQSKNKPPKAMPALMQKEERAVDSVSWSVWGAYIAAFGRFGFLVNTPLIILTIALGNAASVMTNLWLSWWIQDKYNLSTGQYIGIYAGLATGQVLSLFAYSTVLAVSGTNAGRTMFLRAMTRVLRAPMSFFDTTPLGRITNRFSKDIHTMDNDLADAMRIYYLTLTMIISVIVLIIVFYHYFGVALGPLLILFLLAANFYRASAREIKRHEAVLRSVVFAQFTEAISGIPTIRAYGLESQFIHKIRSSIDNMNSAYFITFSNQRWLSIRLDAIGNIMVLVIGILVVTSRFEVSPSISGLVLSYILAIVQMLQFTIRQLAEVENNMNATERIHYYGTQLEEEAALHQGKLEPDWPQTGSISFSNVEMRYRPGLPLVLKGLNMEVKGGERIGIVGRTGAGKSSIMSALFRLNELSSGRIMIDGVDISKIGLSDLRSRLAIIPQDPALFRGTVRSNLDPFNEHTDLELWSALRKAYLVTQDPEPTEKHDQETEKPIENQAQQTAQSRLHLDSSVVEEGLNFSLGQRQLMALARALVRDSRIIVCDEATSSVDFETDQKIQRTMAQGFQGKTLLCIAHRLRTIIHYDRICVMDQGAIIEMDAPLALWEREGGVFRGMCERSGILKEDFFEELTE